MSSDTPRSSEATQAPHDLITRLSEKVVGQPQAMEHIVPYVQMHRAGLSAEGRPVGNFLLLGPTGTGKTRTVEALAEVLHGSAANVLKIDCGEFQSDHEVAKLVGAPPGYIGHRETQPRLTQHRLTAVTTPGCDLSLVLFDEIEKAAPAVLVLLLGVLDKATLQLGDGSAVDFSRSLIFLTSNLGAREMMDEIQPGLGFQAPTAPGPEERAGRLESIGLTAVRKRFSPEFVNRIDVVITYRPLDAAALAAILDQHVAELQQHVHTRLGSRSFEIDMSEAARSFLLQVGTSAVYGAREIKRTIHRHLTQPLAAMVAAGQIAPGATVHIDVSAAGGSLALRPAAGVEVASATAGQPLVLVVDDNPHILEWLGEVITRLGYQVVLAGSVAEATRQMAGLRPDFVLFDYFLPDGDGVTLALEVRQRVPDVKVILMSGMELAQRDAAICEKGHFPVLRKPFLAETIEAALRSAAHHAATSG
jgi:ATP-dependent Clp protease ATP-binding subunit ClpA/ActR/RegA family two-component response regulator